MPKRRYHYEDTPGPEPAPSLEIYPDPDFVLRELGKIAAQSDTAQATKVRALELLMRHHGMLEDRLTVSVDALTPTQRADRVAILIERAQARALPAGSDPESE